LVEARTQSLTVERDAWRPDQFNNPDNPEAHERTTGPELWDQTGGNIAAFVAIVGTGGTFLGVSRYLKNRDAAIQCLAVEPEGVQALAGRPITNPGHRLQGAGYAMIPPAWDPSLCDGTLPISDDEAVKVARELARREGVMAGFSAGANVAAALRLAASAEPGANVVTIACDTGLRYLSTDLFH
jgi:cysteine synthase A